MRRRKQQALESSSGLLLDTLCNALGGVIFIALLIALLAHNAPVLTESAESGSGFDFEEQSGFYRSALADFPSLEALQKRTGAVQASIEAYQSAGFEPVAHSDQSFDQVLAQRDALSQAKSAEAEDVPAMQSETLKVREAKSLYHAADTIVISVDGDEVRMSGLLGADFAQQIMAVGSVHSGDFSIVRESTGLRFYPGSGLFRSNTQLERLMAQREVSRQVRLLFFIYPDGIETFRTFRDEALSTFSYAFWIGLPEGQPIELQFGSTADSF